MTREMSLRRYKEALFNAMASMPAGYAGAEGDRREFVGPVEVVILNLEEAIRSEMGIKK